MDCLEWRSTKQPLLTEVKKGALKEVEVGDVLGFCSSWSRVREGSPTSG